MSAPARRMRGQRFEHRARLVDPAVAAGGLEHRVLAAHVVRGGRDSRSVSFTRVEDVQVRHRRLHHHDVGAFLDVLFDLAQRLADVGRIHLVRLAVAELRRRRRGIAERAVERRAVLRRVRHDRGVLEAALVERPPNRADAAVHHVRRRDDIGAGHRVRHGGPHQLLHARHRSRSRRRPRCRSGRGRCTRTGTRRSRRARRGPRA